MVRGNETKRLPDNPPSHYSNTTRDIAGNGNGNRTKACKAQRSRDDAADGWPQAHLARRCPRPQRPQALHPRTDAALHHRRCRRRGTIDPSRPSLPPQTRLEGQTERGWKADNTPPSHDAPPRCTFTPPQCSVLLRQHNGGSNMCGTPYCPQRDAAHATSQSTWAFPYTHPRPACP